MGQVCVHLEELDHVPSVFGAKSVGADLCMLSDLATDLLEGLDYLRFFDLSQECLMRDTS